MTCTLLVNGNKLFKWALSKKLTSLCLRLNLDLNVLIGLLQLIFTPTEVSDSLREDGDKALLEVIKADLKKWKPCKLTLETVNYCIDMTSHLALVADGSCLDGN